MNVNLKPRVVNKFKVGDENMLFCFFLKRNQKNVYLCVLLKTEGANVLSILAI